MTTSFMETDESPLFDVDLSFENLFTVPAELQSFDRGINDDEIAQYGTQAFTAWLKAKLKKQELTTPAPLVVTACEEEAATSDENLAEFDGIKVRANFFPEFPDADDYQDGEVNLEYRRKVHEADLGVAYAKIACDSCPFKRDCLNSSIVNFEEFGVWGGWSAGARAEINVYFKRLKKGYLSFRKRMEREEFDESTADFHEQMAFWASFLLDEVKELTNLVDLGETADDEDELAEIAA